MSKETKALRIALSMAWLKGWQQVSPGISIPAEILQHSARMIDQAMEGKEALFCVEPLQEKLFDDGIRCANEWSTGSSVWVVR